MSPTKLLSTLIPLIDSMWHHRLTYSLSVIQSPGQVVTIPMEEQIDDLFLCVLLTTPLSSKAHFNHLEI